MCHNLYESRYLRMGTGSRQPGEDLGRPERGAWSSRGWQLFREEYMVGLTRSSGTPIDRSFLLAA